MEICELVRKLRELEGVYEHSKNVSLLAKKFALYIGLSKKEALLIQIGGILHDIGKMQVKPTILNKPGKLTYEEYEEVKRHSQAGFDYLNTHYEGLPDEIYLMALQHHERIDGKGYPQQLKGDDIHFFSKLLSICDVYDALVSVRTYKDAFTQSKALEIIQEGLGTQFDQELGKAFIQFMNNSLNNENTQLKGA